MIRLSDHTYYFHHSELRCTGRGVGTIIRKSEQAKSLAVFKHLMAIAKKQVHSPLIF